MWVNFLMLSILSDGLEMVLLNSVFVFGWKVVEIFFLLVLGLMKVILIFNFFIVMLKRLNVLL